MKKLQKTNYLFSRRVLSFGMLLCFLFAANIVFSAPAMAYVKEYNTLLRKHVKTGTKAGIRTSLVNYKAWEKDKNYPITKNKLLATDHTKLYGEKKKAYWINAYNFLTIDLIIRKKETDSIKNLGNIFQNTWEKYKWKFKDKKYTLDEIEHDILRNMGDPRIHMAINCASISCPDLLKEAYSHERLDEQLNKQTIIFLSNKEKGLKFSSKNEVIISKIFNWFEEDFGDEEGVIRFINSFFPKVHDTSQVKDYIDYNWKLNSQ